MFTLDSVIAQRLVRRAEQFKQPKQIIQIKHNNVKNSNWPEAHQLAIFKRGRESELGATEKQIQVVIRTGLKPETAGLRVRHADHSATLPPQIVEEGAKAKETTNHEVRNPALRLVYSSNLLPTSTLLYLRLCRFGFH